MSVVIASRNEGINLVRTVRSVKESGRGLDLEIVVVDDGSTDDSVAVMRAESPETVIVRHEQSLGVSPARASGVAASTGEVFVFFDAHVKPNTSCLSRLMLGVERSNGNAVIVPMITQFDTETWEPNESFRGYGFQLTLDRFEARWLGLAEMHETRLAGDAYFESPTVVGCSVAVHRDAYAHIMGFDPSMRTWGMEDVDFGIRAWMTGHPVLCDPVAHVAHRFITEFTAYALRYVDLGANQIRMASKILGPETFAHWLELRGLGAQPSVDESEPAKFWRQAWAQYSEDADSLASRSDAFKDRRVMDEYEYSARFNLSWPTRPAACA
jgi:GT2 family glycosyltransferase